MDANSFSLANGDAELSAFGIYESYNQLIEKRNDIDGQGLSFDVLFRIPNIHISPCIFLCIFNSVFYVNFLDRKLQYILYISNMR